MVVRSRVVALSCCRTRVRVLATSPGESGIMCGIAGALDLKGRREFPASRLLAMTGAITHRGPDDEHIHIEPGVALGARRLSIVDLSGGRQPLCNEDGSVWVTQNGELFEYPELQAGAASQRPHPGHALRHRSSGSISTKTCGEGMFAKARGQFAVSLWDRKTRTLDPGSRPGRHLPALLRGGSTAGCSGARRSRRCSHREWSSARPIGRGSTSSSTRSCARDDADVLRGDQVDSPRPLPEGSRRPRRAQAILGPRLSGRRRRSAGSTIRRPLVDELEHLMRQAVERRLRGDVPVVSYISGGLDSTVVLGLSSPPARLRGARRSPSASTGPDPTSASHATESAAALGSRLTTVTMNRADIVGGLSRADPRGRGPGDGLGLRLPDAAGRRRAPARLQGRAHRRRGRRGAGGLCLVQDPEDSRHPSPPVRLDDPRRHSRRWSLGSLGGDPAHLPPRFPLQGVRTGPARPLRPDGSGASFLYSGDMWKQLAGHSAYDDFGITNDRFRQWAPLNQSLYVGYKVMLAGLLLIGKGDRVAMNSSVETRYPFLDDDVIAFCASIAPEYKLHRFTDKWLLRQVAARTLPPRIANRPKTMFRASRSEAFLGPEPSRLGRSAPEPRVARSDRLLRRRRRPPRARRPGSLPAGHTQAHHHGPEPHLRRGDPTLAPHVPGRRPVRLAHVDAVASAPADRAQPGCLLDRRGGVLAAGLLTPA